MRKIISLTLATAMVASMAVSAFAVGEEQTWDSGKHAQYEFTIGEGPVDVIIEGDAYSVDGETKNEKVINLAELLNDKIGSDYDIIAYTNNAATIYWYKGAPSVQVVKKKVGNLRNFGARTGAGSSTGITTPILDGAIPANWRSDWTAIINPDALVEDGDWNNDDGVKPGKSIYFAVNGIFGDLDVFEFDLKKGENAKQIKSVTVIEKTFKDGLYYLKNHEQVGGTAGERRTYIEVKLADNMTDKEFKISFDMKVKVDKKNNPYGLEKGDHSDKFEEIAPNWVANSSVTSDDEEYLAGTGGIMLKPQKNEENEVLWTDNNRDLARLTFVADSDVAKYFPKLSTKWPNATYAQLFDDQDAFVFDFVGNPKISSTSRAVLELFCPFLDADDEYSIDPESVVIYQVADDATLAASTEVELAKAILDGRLIDVTDKFTAGENEDGDFVYTTKTRTLGTYIIAEKAPSEEAFEEAEGEAPDEKPTEDTGKDNPGTGR